MNDSPKYDIPWDLISGSFSGGLVSEEEQQLQQWLSSDPENKIKYAQLKDLWGKGIEDYRFYKLANEQEAWKALQSKLDKPNAAEKKVIKGEFVNRPSIVKRIIAIASVFIGIVVFGIWYASTRNNPMVYQTAMNEQRKVLLSDSSVITLQSSSRIEVAKDYNKTRRTIVMISGEANFVVRHLSYKPFIVELGKTEVKDIGTVFTIKKSEKEVHVEVASGRVAFTKHITKETKELSAGSEVTFDVSNESFGEVKSITSASASKNLNMNFDNTPLLNVVEVIQKVYGEKVIVKDSTIINKRFTAHLEGMPCKTAIEVICKSLGLEYTENEGVYVLTKRDLEQH